jgi:hypothetical protein
MTAVTCETYDLTCNSASIETAMEANVNNDDKVIFIQKGGSNSVIMVVYRNG